MATFSQQILSRYRQKQQVDRVGKTRLGSKPKGELGRPAVQRRSAQGPTLSISDWVEAQDGYRCQLQGDESASGSATLTSETLPISSETYVRGLSNAMADCAGRLGGTCGNSNYRWGTCLKRVWYGSPVLSATVDPNSRRSQYIVEFRLRCHQACVCRNHVSSILGELGAAGNTGQIAG